MGKIIVGRFLLLFGLYKAAGMIFLSGQTSFTSILYCVAEIGAGLFLAMSKPSAPNIRRPPVPADFNPSIWHENIALDTNSGKIWLRDEGGADSGILKGPGHWA